MNSSVLSSTRLNPDTDQKEASEVHARLPGIKGSSRSANTGAVRLELKRDLPLKTLQSCA